MPRFRLPRLAATGGWICTKVGGRGRPSESKGSTRQEDGSAIFHYFDMREQHFV
jgi:hypothetical protein